jgi:hypothetical protein
LLKNRCQTISRVRFSALRYSNGLRTLLVAFVFCLLTAAGTEARAIGKVAVLPFTGPPIPVVQRALYVCQRTVTSSIPPAYQLVPPANLARTMGGGRPAAPSEFIGLARRHQATALIEGMVTVEGRRRWRLRVIVRRASTGLPVGTVTWSGVGSRPLISNLQRNAGQWVASLLQRTGGPTAEPPGGDGGTPVAMGEDDDEPSDSDRPVAAGDEDSGISSSMGSSGRRGRANMPSTWAFSLGPRLVSRTFVFTDNVAQLPGYNLPGAPALAGEVEFFPALRTDSVARNIGFAAFYESTIGAKTQRSDGGTGATLARSYRVGARYRVPLDTAAVLLGTDYMQHFFNLDVDNALPPNVNYSVVRPSVAGRVSMGRKLVLGLTAAYLHILSAGALSNADRFPNLTTLGAEAGATVSYMLDNELDLTAGVDMRYYAHTMNAQPGDPPNRLVGGAIDAHLGASVMLTYRLR